MADVHDPSTRSRNMAAIRAADTKPEIAIRSLLFSAGYRYRLGSKYRISGQKLPGTPDLIFPTRRLVVFINGCFWHRHLCKVFRWPGTRSEWWKSKLEGNAARDSAQWRELRASGWRILVVWECAIRGATRITEAELLKQFRACIDGKDDFLEVAGR